MNENTISEKLLKPYDPIETESRIYKLWEESGFFNPDICIEKGVTKPDAEPFSIVLPPPNATGRLHLGHVLEHAIQDTMIRFERMRGKRTLWIPGTDHAAIATQARFEKELYKKEGTSRHDFDRETFFSMVQEFALTNRKDMQGQMRLLGSSLDWSREAFTLDEKRSYAVRVAFKNMYDTGLIYRGHRIVNWDPKGQTTISDDEIVYEERKAKLYTFKYGKDFPISISTTRPETKVGDTAVAVHPDDPRYKEFVGKEYDVEFCGVPLHIKIVTDEGVEKEFGTGALGVTPAHSMTDWEIANRNDLPRPQVINELAKMMVGDERIIGKKVTEAREIIVEWLRSQGLLEKEEEIDQRVSTAERTGGIVEPLPKLQWFINVNSPIKTHRGKTLKELMREPVANGEINIMPEHFQTIYFNWIDNLRDWCISRQIIYGHRIPVWYCLHCKNPAINLVSNEKIYLIRHGETDYNREGKLQGQTDIPLNDLGKMQAKEAGRKLKNKKIDYIFCSDLSRTQETAEIIQNEIGSGEIVCEKGLRERSYGELEGTDAHEAKIKYPEIKDYKGKVAGVESYQEVEERIFQTFEIITNKYKGKNIVIVSHGAALRMLIKKIKNLDESNFPPRGSIKNAEVIPIDHSLAGCSVCKNHLFEQDEDTLDTWFSSGLWTFSTLGWPEKTKDLEVYHPNTFMDPGYEIIFFWVARMIMMSQFHLKQIPFKSVLFHGIVRDKSGKKFSKSSGNGIEPEEVIAQFGTDALRMSMLVGTGPGSDVNFDIQKVKAYKLFANKLWNIMRFVIVSAPGAVLDTVYTVKDNLRRTQFDSLLQEITKDLEEHRLHLAAEKVYHYLWDTFASDIIEESKQIMKSLDEKEKESRKRLLWEIFTDSLKILHPFMPFITEEIWSMLPGRKNVLMVELWPSMSK